MDVLGALRMDVPGALRINAEVEIQVGVEIQGSDELGCDHHRRVMKWVVRVVAQKTQQKAQKGYQIAATELMKVAGRPLDHHHHHHTPPDFLSSRTVEPA